MGNSCKSERPDDHEAVIGDKRDDAFVPKNCWNEKTVMEKTDNYNKVMGRTWYLIANSMEKDDQACLRNFFVENYDWRKQGETGYNHTFDRVASTGKYVDYGKWNVFIQKDGKMYMQPTIGALCGAGIPAKIKINTISFPINDRHDQTWTYYFDSVHFTKDGQMKFYPLVWIFALTPHLAEEDYQRELFKLQTVHGIDMRHCPLTKHSWDPNF